MNDTTNSDAIPLRMTAEEIAAIYAVHAETVRRWARDHGAPAITIGRRWRFDPVAIDHWLRARTDAARHP